VSKHAVRDPATGRFVTIPPPMRHETNGFTGLHTDTDAPRPWRLTAAWVLLGAAIGWLACVVVRSL
jgi:hypothetical protein